MEGSVRQLKFQFEPGQPERTVAPEALDWPLFMRRLRWQLGLNQAEFANAYRIDLERLAEVESARAEPDEALAAYLHMIDRTPELIARLWMAAA
jgi:DNA-binding transcriptional regulator YiaG